MENNLAVSLCLLIGQQRDCIVYKEKANVKLAGNLYDQVRTTCGLKKSIGIFSRVLFRKGRYCGLPDLGRRGGERLWYLSVSGPWNYMDSVELFNRYIFSLRNTGREGGGVCIKIA